MKKLYLLISFAFILISSVFFFACKKEYSPADAVDDQIKLNDKALEDSLKMNAIRDSLRKISGVVHYTINIVDGSDAGFSSLKSTKKAKSIIGLKVIASQYGKTISISDTTGLGIITIKDLRIGTVSIKIQATDFTECSYIAELTPVAARDTNLYRATRSDVWNLERNVGTMVPLFETTGSKLATISGVVTLQSDLTNIGREKAANVNVIGAIDVDNSDFVSKYMASFEHIGWTSENYGSVIDYYGNIVKIAYNSTVFQSLTDANGAYTLKVPATGDGLPIRIEISDVAVDQTLLLNTLNNVNVFGTQTVRTLFSSNYTPSTIPFVPAAYCTFSAPTGTGVLDEPAVVATATAVVSESGIISITASDPGLGYTQAPKVVITPTGYTPIAMAQATATIGTDGRVSDIVINNAGVGYPTAALGISTAVSITGSETAIATATPILTYSVSDINVTNGGSGYSAAPAVTITSNSGTGATAVAKLTGVLTKVNVIDGGSGYTTTPVVSILGDGKDAKAAVANMTNDNPVHSIKFSVPSGLFLTVGTYNTRITGDGSGATTGPLQFGSNGRLNVINLTAGGSGYTSEPTVSIIGGNGSARAHATIAGGVVNGIIIDNAGEGYSATPTITIAGGGGSGATATAVLEKEVVGVNVTSAGNGYNTATIEYTPDGGTTWTDMGPGDLDIATVLFSQSVRNINVTAAGIGYTTAPTVSITSADGNGTGASASAEILSTVHDIIVTNAGSGYLTGDVTVSIAAPASGAQATATANLAHGVLSKLVIDNPGAGYTAAPIVSIIGGGATIPATATATISATGQVSSLTIDNSGANYTSAPTVTIKTCLRAATATALCNSKSGQIIALNLTGNGEGYKVAPVVEFYYNTTVSGNGNGTSAAATATIEGGRVTDLTITNGGSGYYTAPTVKFTMPNLNQTAQANLTISADGYITGITLPGGVASGYGYVTTPTITITPSVTGIGSGAQAIVTKMDGSRVTAVKVVNSGRGYVGKNNPGPAINAAPINGESFTVITAGSAAANSINNISALTGKTYIRDIYLGTGKRSIEQ